ncbi:hypothetical protein BJ138DRAFT_1168737 [Hygrophoropsis aurantiaca]|uniref:Uncharacterized protein n=1 Tax=Hygrophoropsis aurantiaca TaxID=72124 RepID=A0ACB7ZP98_9AGAM|nr:hypothetical protein BJ138DRAFT_1168737 [Hygrophoropsis aurantiaca]
MQPVYADSTVLNATQPALLQLCTSQNYTQDNAPVDIDKDSRRSFDCEIAFDEYDSDSDYDETEVKDEPDAEANTLIEEIAPHKPSPNVRDPPPAYHPIQNAIRTIQINGVALNTLKALIYHCYTSEISFRPLKSSSVDIAKDQPLLPSRIYCSPKSMYRLADKIGAEELKKLSLESIRAGLSKHNILDEVFSHFTSRYPEVLNMELDLLLENVREPEVVQALRGKMKALVCGAFPHSDEVIFKIMQRAK